MNAAEPGAGGHRGGGRPRGGGPRRLANRACADTGTRPFSYRWNRDAPFLGRGRFSRTRGDEKRARTEAPSGSAAGEPLPEATAGGRLKQLLRRGASPISDPRMPPAVAAAETRKRGRELRRSQRLRRRASLTASGRRAEGGGRAGAEPDVTCVGGAGRGKRAAGAGQFHIPWRLWMGFRNAVLLPNLGPELAYEKPGAGCGRCLGVLSLGWLERREKKWEEM